MSTAGILQIEILAGIARLSDDMKKAERVVGDSTGRMEKSVTSLQNQFSKLGMGLSFGLMIDQIRRLSDSFTKVTAQMRIATAGQAEYAKGMEDVRRISTSAQAGVEATTMLYTRLTNSLKQNGATQQDVGRITESVSLGLKAYGATTAEAGSAMLQLSQAFGSGRLAGEEFRAVAESMPNMLAILAKSMNVPTSALKQLATEGKITSEVMMKAWSNPAVIEALRAQAAMTRTITGELQVLRNELTFLVGEFMGASGSTGGITSAISAMSNAVLVLAENLKTIVTLITILGIAYAGKYAVGLAMAIEKTIALADATAMNAAINLRASQQEAALAAAKVATASATAASTVSLLRNTIVTVEANTATLAKTVADNAATIAQLNHARSVAQLSGHYYIIRQVEAELVVTTQALAVAQTELNASTARQARLQATLIAEDRAALKSRADLVKANAAVVVSQNAVSASAIGSITAIAVAIRAATMAHPIIAATTAIAAIVVAIANWDAIVKSSKASLSWFRDDFLGGFEFAAKATGIAIAELVAKSQLEAKRARGEINKDDYKKQWDELGKLAEQSRVEAAARIAGLDKQVIDKEKLAAAERYAADRKEWEKATNTKAQQRQAEIDAHNEQYLKIIAGQEMTSEAMLAESARYNVRLAEINEKYSKEAVKAENKAAKEAAKALEELNKQLEDGRKYYQEYWASVEKSTEKLIEQAKQQEWENSLIGKTKEEIAALTILREDEAIVQAEASLTTMLANKAKEEEVRAIGLQIAALYRLKAAREGRATASAAAAAIAVETKAHEDMWKKVDEFAREAYDNILEKGENVFKSIGKAIKRYVLDILYQMTVQKWIFNIAATTGGVSGAGMAMAGGGGTAGGVGGAGSWLSAGSSAYSALTAGITTSISQGVAQVGAAFWNMGAEKIGTSIMSNIGPITTAISYVGAGLAGISLGTMIAGDKKLGGMSGQTASAIGTAIGAYWGPPGMLIGGIIGGIASAAFGMGPKQSGTTNLSGQFGSSGFAGQYETPWSQKGGWFRSNKSGVDVQGVGAEQAAALGTLVGGTKSVFDKLITASGEAEKSISGWTFAINRQVATQEQQNQLIIDMANSMGRHMIPELESFKDEGENLADTAVRMADVFILTDGILRMVGGTFNSVGMASLKMRDSLVDLLGGLQQANTAMQGYYNNFYSETERVMDGWGTMATLLRSLGVEALPTTNAQFRALVEAQDLSTQSGQEVFASLILLSSTFSELTTVTESLSQQTSDLLGNLNLLTTKSFKTLVDYTRYLQKSVQGGTPINEQVSGILAAAPAATDIAAIAAEEQRLAAESAVRTAKKAAGLIVLNKVIADNGASHIAASYHNALNIAGHNANIARAQAVYDALPAYDIGTNALTSDGPIFAHAGEEIKPKAYVDKDKKEREETNKILSELKAEVIELKRGMVANATSTNKTAKLMDRWNGEGMPPVRATA